MNIFDCNLDNFLSYYGIQIEYVAIVTFTLLMYLIFCLLTTFPYLSYNRQALHIYQNAKMLVINFLRLISIIYVYDHGLINIEHCVTCYLRLGLLIYILEIVDLMVFCITHGCTNSYKFGYIIGISILMIQCFYGKTFLSLIIMHVNYQCELFKEITYFFNKKFRGMIYATTKLLVILMTFTLINKDISINEMWVCILAVILLLSKNIRIRF